MSSEPMVRAGIPHSTWVELKRLSEQRIDQARALLGGAIVRQLEAASPMTWLPFEIEARLADTVYEMLGAASAQRFYRGKTVRGFDLPLLREATGATVRMFGVSPVSIVKMTGRVWALMSKNAGRYECIDESSEGRAIAIMRQFPIRLYGKIESWKASALGGWEGLFATFRMRVRVGVDSIEPTESRFALHWSPQTLMSPDFGADDAHD
jgi:hypothetical protein